MIALVAAFSLALATAGEGKAVSSFTKTAPETVAAGQNITYTIALVSGTTEVTNYNVTDTLPSGLTFVSVATTSGNPCGLSGTAAGVVTVGCILPVGVSVTVTLVLHVPVATPVGTVLSNTANLAYSVANPNTASGTPVIPVNQASNTTATLVTGPLAATFRGFSAVATKNGVDVRWKTASEVDVLGFNVYRATNGRRVRLNNLLIAARASTAGAAYSFADRTARRTSSLRYWIQVVNLDGSRSWYGPAKVTVRA